MSFRVLSAALDDLEEIDEWVTDQFGPSFAAKTHVRLFADFALLDNMPQLGRRRPDITDRPVRFFISTQYWIVYEPATPLLIHRIIHTARDLPSAPLI